MLNIIRLAIWAGVLGAVVPCQSVAEMSGKTLDCVKSSKPLCDETLLLHVPSPEWQDQIIY